MQTYLITVLLLSAFATQTNSANQSDTKLSRRKRYIAFPEGSTLSIAICMQAVMIYSPGELWTEALNWGVSYDLPNISATLDLLHPYYSAKRRNRRDLYQKMELIMNSMGYDGKTCIYRTLCETGSLFKKKGTVLEEIFKSLFRFPLERILDSEPDEHKHYQFAHQVGRERGSEGCSEKFPGCSFSLLDFALGGFAISPPHLPLFSFT